LQRLHHPHHHCQILRYPHRRQHLNLLCLLCLVNQLPHQRLHRRPLRHRLMQLIEILRHHRQHTSPQRQLLNLMCLHHPHRLVCR
jgi:ribosomal 50S subunit-associated protein YjgA (DUF615 family)